MDPVKDGIAGERAELSPDSFPSDLLIHFKPKKY